MPGGVPGGVPGRSGARALLAAVNAACGEGRTGVPTYAASWHAVTRPRTGPTRLRHVWCVDHVAYEFAALRTGGEGEMGGGGSMLTLRLLHNAKRALARGGSTLVSGRGRDVELCTESWGMSYYKQLIQTKITVLL